MNIEQASPDSRVGSKRPIFLLVALAFIPVAYAACFFYVRRTSHPDFLGFDIARAVRHSHWPASFLAVLLSLASLARGERFRAFGLLLAVVSVVWLVAVIILDAR